MYDTLAGFIRQIFAELSGDVVKKYRPTPKIKPPRRKPSVTNKTDRSDYMKDYIKKYREEGKDYQKVPDKIKEFRKKHRKKKRVEVNLNTPTAHLDIIN